ncbi:DUF4145 domain-containing protein [Lysobacter enzymogenes]|uniref:DUF4145 domain-containing protein n=1 Tax=Lysobacter enzymogenes TaxID=69 RepID=UPI0008980793|nr:DUF4145 domain-containing protein [Lysobacter enzymogenes]SDW14299.1 protein of unknown function [Lysobacter enzymogenes]
MPKNTVTREINKTANAVIDAQCSECKRSTKHLVLASVNIDGENWFGENSVQYWAEYQVIMCQGCEITGFRSSSRNSEDWDFIDLENVEYNETLNLYPARDGRSPLKDVYLLPGNVQRIYEETIKAINNNQPVLVGIGLRAIVETVCKDKSSPGANLVQRIDGLVSQGSLSPEGAKILHKIRTLGNDAAHEVKPHSEDQLGVALDVCEHLLQDVYVLPQHAARAFT